jgi:hypothetical protein
VIEPAAYQESEIAYPVDPKKFVARIYSGDGTYLKSLLILPRKTIEPEDTEQGNNELMCKCCSDSGRFDVT